MKQIFEMVRRQVALGAAVLALMGAMVAASWAQSENSAEPIEFGWQAVITSQINAFRMGDAAAALELAASGFKQTYSDPEIFMRDVLTMGYAPILHSKSHSFGAYRPGGEGVVMQMVQVIGDDQGYYEAWYRLGYETDGWRVLGVALSPKQGVGI